MKTLALFCATLFYAFYYDNGFVLLISILILIFYYKDIELMCIKYFDK